MTGKQAAGKPYEGPVAGMFQHCSLRVRNLAAPGAAASDNCGDMATAAAFDNELGFWLWRCGPHEHMLDVSGKRAFAVTREWPPPAREAT